MDIGSALIKGASAVAKAPFWAIGKAVTGTYETGKAVLDSTAVQKAADGVGTATSAMIGRAAGTVARDAAVIKQSAIEGIDIAGHPTASRILGNMTNPLTVPHVGSKIGSKLVNIENESVKYNSKTRQVEKKDANISINKKGMSVLLGASVLAGGIGAAQEIDAKSLGTMDNRVTTATPDYQPQEYTTTVNPVGSSIDLAGASGDLVFSLFRNRNRSML